MSDDTLRFELKVSREASFTELLEWVAEGVERGLLKRDGHTLSNLHEATVESSETLPIRKQIKMTVKPRTRG